MKKRQLQVALEAHTPSVVDVTVRETVQLDRIIIGRRGRVAQRYGALLAPGTTTLALVPGQYSFKTLSEAALRVVSGGVDAAPAIHTKGDPGDPPVQAGANGAGDEPEGEATVFIVE